MTDAAVVPYDPLALWFGTNTPALGSIGRADFLAQVEDDVVGRLIHLDRKAAGGSLTQHEALERTRLWSFHDWLKRETVAAFSALPPATSDKLRAGEPI